MKDVLIPIVWALSAAAVSMMLIACGDDTDVMPDPVVREIRPGDTIVALMSYNSTGYFLYRGQALGYEYDLLQAFAEDNGLVLKTRIVRNRDSLFRMLLEGTGDLVAARVVPTQADSQVVAFTRTLYTTQPALVQREAPPGHARLPEAVRDVLTDDSANAHRPMGEPPAADSMLLQMQLIRRPWELAGHEVHLPGRSPYLDRLVEIADAITGDIEIVELDDDVASEAVIRGVSSGRYALTVAPRNLARLKESYFSNIVVQPALGPAHPITWAVRPNSPVLLKALNRWIERTKQRTDLFDQLYRKYFVDRQGYRERIESEYLSSETGRLSDYDTLLQRYAPRIDWDWRLLAAQTYQESRFRPAARSWAGAMGLLQLMPGTAADMNVADPYDPQQNVRGAVDYLQYLTDFWSHRIPDDEERLKFILASYNAGAGHVRDAQRLTRKYGGDTLEWDDVAYWLLQLSKQRYYNDPVVRHGFCRGLEPVTYVARILERYDHYRQFVIS